MRSIDSHLPKESPKWFLVVIQVCTTTKFGWGFFISWQSLAVTCFVVFKHSCRCKLYRIQLYLLHIRYLSDMLFLNIFFHLVGCCFIWMSTICWRYCILQCEFLPSLAKIRWLYVCEFVSATSIWSYWSTYLFPHHTIQFFFFFTIAL